MKMIVLVLLVIFANVGCARVQVQAPKEPIKVDISMRLDIYQHIENDIDKIEDIVSGEKEKGKSPDKPQSLLDFFIGNVYAQELDPQIEQAALRRKDRHPELISGQQKGVFGENRLGLLEIRDSNVQDDTFKKLLEE